MPGKVIGTSLNLGFAGKISRSPDTIVSSRMVKSIISGTETQPSIPFGATVKLNTDNTYSKYGASGAGVASDNAANFAGIAVAEVKQMTTYGNVSGNGQYDPLQPCDVIQRGSVVVACVDGTPTAGGDVYVCSVAGGSIVIGDLVCSATPTGGGTAVLLTNCKWTTNKVDANGMSELTILNRTNP